MPSDDEYIKPHFIETPDEEVQRMGDHYLKHSRPVATLVPTKSDAELAEEFKKKVAEAYQPLIAVLDEYDKHGLNMQASVGKNAFGKFQIVQLIVMKQF